MKDKLLEEVLDLENIQKAHSQWKHTVLSSFSYVDYKERDIDIKMSEIRELILSRKIKRYLVDYVVPQTIFYNRFFSHYDAYSYIALLSITRVLAKYIPSINNEERLNDIEKISSFFSSPNIELRSKEEIFIKTDISSFYNSIDISLLIDFIRNDIPSLRDSKVFEALKFFLTIPRKNELTKEIRLIERGLAVGNIAADMFANYFIEKILKKSGIHEYPQTKINRRIDDINILVYGGSANENFYRASELILRLNSTLNCYGLTLNKEKTKYLILEDIHIKELERLIIPSSGLGINNDFILGNINFKPTNENDFREIGKKIETESDALNYLKKVWGNRFGLDETSYSDKQIFETLLCILKMFPREIYTYLAVTIILQNKATNNIGAILDSNTISNYVKLILYQNLILKHESYLTNLLTYPIINEHINRDVNSKYYTTRNLLRSYLKMPDKSSIYFDFTD